MKVMMTLQKANHRRLFDKWNMLILLISFIVLSCDKDDAIKPHGNSQAIPIYNQAYSENFDLDNIDDIIKEARNEYVLIDHLGKGIDERINEIKVNNNEVGG